MTSQLVVTASRQFYFGEVAERGLTLSDLNAFEGYFSCGLIAGKAQSSEEWQKVFHILIAAGCRGIAISGQHAVGLEDIFDGVIVSLYAANDSNVVWSTTHPSLEDMLLLLLTLDLSDDYAQAKGTTYILQYGGDSLRDFCRAELISADEELNDEYNC